MHCCKVIVCMLVLAQVLDRAAQLAEDGQGGVLLLEGDVGTGKSRLLQEVRCSPLAGLRKQAGGDGALTVFASSGDPVRKGRVRHGLTDPASSSSLQCQQACSYTHLLLSLWQGKPTEVAFTASKR